MTAYSLTLKPTKSVRKAVITVAGFGTRMYPFTRGVKKEFAPVLDKDGLVTKKFAREDVVLSRKDNFVESDYEKIESFLGTNYKTKIYDYSQGMNEHIYYDRDNNIQLEIVYYEGASGKQIAFIVMSNVE